MQIKITNFKKETNCKKVNCKLYTTRPLLHSTKNVCLTSSQTRPLPFKHFRQQKNNTFFHISNWYLLEETTRKNHIMIAITIRKTWFWESIRRIGQVDLSTFWKLLPQSGSNLTSCCLDPIMEKKQHKQAKTTRSLACKQGRCLQAKNYENNKQHNFYLRVFCCVFRKIFVFYTFRTTNHPDLPKGTGHFWESRWWIAILALRKWDVFWERNSLGDGEIRNDKSWKNT